MDEKKKIGELSEKEIETITEFLNNPKLPDFLLNRKKYNVYIEKIILTKIDIITPNFKNPV